jgi:predicted hydrocarbon binding protein
MDVLGIQNEYDWVVKILKSAKSLTHIEMTDKLLSFFLKKWGGVLNYDQKNTFYYDFIKIKDDIILKIEKNGVIM